MSEHEAAGEMALSATRTLRVSDYYVRHPSVFIPDLARDGYFTLGRGRRTMLGVPDQFYSMSPGTPQMNVLFDVLQAGYSTWELGDRYTRLHSKGFAIELVTEGRGELRVGQKRYVLRPNDVFILHPDERHSYRACSREPFKKIFVTLSVSTPMHRGILAATPFAELSHLSLPAEVARQVEELMKRIIAIAAEGGAGAARQASLVACELLTVLLEVVQERVGEPDLDERLRKVMEYAIEHLHERLSMEGLARVAGVTAGHLNRLFMKAVGMRAHEWLLKLRMRYAAELMHKTPLTIHEIGEVVGYDNPYAFTRAFKLVTGMAPVTYRQRLWNVRQAVRRTGASPLARCGKSSGQGR